jgi:cytochrome b6-f complex iron-sulfur subunit
MDRRTFFKSSFSKIMGFLTALVLAYPVFSFLSHRKIRKIMINFSPEEQTSPVYHKEGVFLINNGKEVFALSASCTHLGCTLNYDLVSRTFKCPCHGSTFDGSGKWLAGPAKADLNRVPLIKKETGDIVVTLEL